MIILFIEFFIILHFSDSLLININGKACQQSDTWGDHAAKLAIDGDSSTYSIACNNCKLPKNNSVNTGWWQLDLEQKYVISSLYLTASPDYSNSEYLAEFKIYISETNETSPSSIVCVNFTNRPHLNPHERQQLVCENPSIGRYITVRRNGGGFRPEALAIAELEVDAVLYQLPTTTTQPSGQIISTTTTSSSTTLQRNTQRDLNKSPENIAAPTVLDTSSMTARQVGTFGTFEARLAIDSQLSTFSIACSGRCDANNPSPLSAWWQLDMRRSHVVTAVEITSSPDETNAKYLQNFSILVSPTNNTDFENKSTLCYFYDRPTPLSTFTTERFPCLQPMSGRYLSIAKRRGSYRWDALSMADVKVFGFYDPVEKRPYDNLDNLDNLANALDNFVHTNKPTTTKETHLHLDNLDVVKTDEQFNTVIDLTNCTTSQSGTFGDHSSKLAVDGNVATWSIACSTCDASLGSEAGQLAWWAVLLDADYLVNAVLLVSAMDDYNAKYLQNFTITNGMLNDSETQICNSYTNETFHSMSFTLNVSCRQPIRARQILIVRNGGFRSDAISLAEVTVIGRKISGEKIQINEPILNNSLNSVDEVTDYKATTKFFEEHSTNPTAVPLRDTPTSQSNPSENDIIVKLTLGNVRGFLYGVNISNTNNILVNAFYDIPYAKPPLGQLRFEAPLPAEPWEGTQGSKSSQKSCIQFDSIKNLDVGSEDCLTLNIFSPANRTNNSLSVIVFVHGENLAEDVSAGQFLSGGASAYPGHILATHNVVIVVPNFRLGLLGYLQTRDSKIQGNMALLDLVQALKFVKENIDQFGGSPNDVTLFGSDSGAYLASLLSTSSLSKDLFQKLITTSRSALSKMFLTSNVPNDMFDKIVGDVGCTGQDGDDLIACFKMVPVYKLQNATFNNCKGKHICEFNSPMATPNASTWVDVGSQATLTQDIQHLKPLLSGFCLNQDTAITTEASTKIGPTQFFDFIKDIYLKKLSMLAPFNESQSETLFRVIKLLYTPYTRLDEPTAYNDALVELITDTFYGSVWDSQLTLQSTISNNVFAFILNATTNTKSFSCEIPYIFGFPYLESMKLIEETNNNNNQNLTNKNNISNKPSYSPDDENLAINMISLITNFAKFNTPTSVDINESNNTLSWRPFKPTFKNVLIISKQSMTEVRNYRALYYSFYQDYLHYLIRRDSF